MRAAEEENDACNLVTICMTSLMANCVWNSTTADTEQYLYSGPEKMGQLLLHLRGHWTGHLGVHWTGHMGVYWTGHMGALDRSYGCALDRSFGCAQQATETWGLYTSNALTSTCGGGTSSRILNTKAERRQDFSREADGHVRRWPSPLARRENCTKDEDGCLGNSSQPFSK